MSKYWLPTNNYRRRQKLKNLNCNFIFVTQVYELQLIVRIIYMLAFWQRSRKKMRGILEANYAEKTSIVRDCKSFDQPDFNFQVFSQENSKLLKPKSISFLLFLSNTPSYIANCFRKLFPPIVSVITDQNSYCVTRLNSTRTVVIVK